MDTMQQIKAGFRDLPRTQKILVVLGVFFTVVALVALFAGNYRFVFTNVFLGFSTIGLLHYESNRSS